ncbi:zona pellucida sperm-binding protein 4-like isoform X2 [Hemicordylus capensis]|uniref:zona pellucida sperm-binding protein 4-like isoform X2 n=1 Tax=Hemicordylus capensis TaxID=884348 RepID=UPI002304C6F1|nr:zona pellucida sperm-binding protein 4-like isoform X2 [Hemicordylus capensis]
MMLLFREFACLLFWGVQVSFCGVGPFGDTALLSCKEESLQFLLIPKTKAFLSGVKLLDHEDKPHPLQNDSLCGTSVAPRPDGSVAVKVAFMGCYAKAQDGSYQVTIQMEGAGAGGQITSYKEELRCPEPLLARLPCLNRQLGQEDCEALGCCYNSRDRVTPCYYGSKVTAHCTPDGQFSIAVSRNATRPPLNLDSVHLVSNERGRCASVARTNLFILFQFPLSACGTTFKESPSQRLYENELMADRQILRSRAGSITRDSRFRLTVRCSYSAEASLPLSVLVSPPPSLMPVAQQGPLTLEMRIARNERYDSYYTDLDYPVAKVLRDPIPVEVRILGRNDPALVLVLHDCWATPSTNPMQKPEWPLLKNGCPYKGDNYQTQLLSIATYSELAFPSHRQRFIIFTFTFVEAASQRMLTGPVYFHCSASACVPSAEDSCSVNCDATSPGRRQRAAKDPLAVEQLTLVTSDGPVDFGQIPGLTLEGRRFSLEELVRWDDALIITAAIVAMLSVGMLAAFVLTKRWGRWQRRDLPRA